MKIKNKSKTLEKISNQFWGVIYRFYNMISIARTDRENVLKPPKPVSPRPPAPILLSKNAGPRTNSGNYIHVHCIILNLK